MQLRYESGPDKGKEIELSPPFISLGRETDNDVIIGESEVSRYHAKIEMDGSVWVVRDLESSNGVRINGQKINESAPLEHRDEVRVGSMTFTIIDPTKDSEPATAVVPAPTEAAPKPAQPATKIDPKKSAAQKRIRLMATALFTMLVVFVALFLINTPSRRKRGNSAELRKKRFEKAKLDLVFRHEKSGFEEDLNDYNLELYEVTIKDRKMTVRVEKLLEGVSFTKTDDLTESEETRLKDAILGFDEEEDEEEEDDVFVNAKSLPPKTRTDGHERKLLMVRAGNRGNAVEYVNEEGRIPATVGKAIFAIRETVNQKFNIPVYSVQEAFALAKDEYILAKGKSDERLADDLNLWKAIVHAKKALAILEPYNQTPPFYRDLQDLYASCKKDHENKIDKLLKDAQIYERTDLVEAKATYQKIMKRIGDQYAPAYLQAREKVTRIENELNKRGRR